MTNAASLLAGGEPGRSTVSVRAGSLARAIAIVFFAAAVLWPIVWVAIQGYTLTGMFEESVGYRYFYSLRKVYDPPAYLFTAQGQSIDVIQALIQIALTWLGFPPTQAEPRIDYFCYASMIVFQLFNISAFAWMIWRIESVGGIVLSALFWLVPFYEPHQSGIYTLLQPDYMTLECALALVAAGSILRIHHTPAWRMSRIVFFGLFIGTAVATKITFLTYPSVAFAYAILQERDLRKAAVKTIYVGLIGVAWWLLLAVGDSAGHLLYAITNVRDLLTFMAAGSGDIVKQDYNWPVWLVRQIIRSPVYLALIYATPIFAMIALLISRTKQQFTLSAPFLLVSVGSNNRDYPNSLIEAAFFFELALFVLVPLVLLPRLSKNVGRAVVVLAWPIAILLCGFIAGWFPIGVWALVGNAKQNTEFQKDLAGVQEKISGKRIWLVPTNYYRPLSIDSAIMKGGAVGGSSTMRMMFPDRDYRFQDPKPVHLADYKAVLFVAYEELDQAIARISSEYSIDLSAWRCRQVGLLGDPNVGSSCYQDIIMCTPDAAGSTS